MNALQAPNPISPRELNRLLAGDSAIEMLDVRSPAEHDAAHVPGVKLIPLDQLDAVTFLKQRAAGGKPIYVLCQTGGRARRAIEKFERAGCHDCVLVDGGTEAWIAEGLPVNRGRSRVLPIMRQVQITVGVVSAVGSGLALVVDRWFAVLPLITGCGLLFAGVTGSCALALLLAKMPWNKVVNPQTGSSCPIQ